MKKKAAISKIMEELVSSVQNQYDQKCWRLLIDYHFNGKEHRVDQLKAELAEIKL